MKPGIESQTSIMTCMARALSHGRTPVTRFSDPTAQALLPGEAQERVVRLRQNRRPAGLRARIQALHLERLAPAMVARTVTIDDAVRGAASPQVVILGAGLDGRAWRMPELGEATVYEVDHPDSQRAKRSRAAVLTPLARAVRFVPVDFARDRLDEALAVAGHDLSLPTTWIWEGVVMYLTPADVEATLAAVSRRSAQGSRLIIAYHSPAPMLRLLGPFLRRIGEPLLSAFSPAAMCALLERHGFHACRRDEGLPTLGAALAPEVGRATRHIKHLRIVVADR